MLASDLLTTKQRLKHLLPEEGMGTVIKELKKLIPENSAKLNALLHMESRLNEVNLKRIKGLLNEEQLQVHYNNLREDLLTFIDGLEETDFSAETAQKAKMGSILYKIPREMELDHQTKCVVRLAFKEEVIIKNIELTAEISLKPVRVSESMEVSLIDPLGANFAINTISTPEQFLERDDYSEWIFYVTPLRAGKHPLVLKVSVIELVSGKERKKDIVLEEFIQIVTQPVEEEDDEEGEGAGSFHHAGYSFNFSSSSTADYTAADSPAYVDVPGGGTSTAGRLRKYSLIMVALVMVSFGAMALDLLQEFFWQKAKFFDNIEYYEDYLEKYPDGKHILQALEKRDFKNAMQQKSDSLIVDFLIKYPESEHTNEAKVEYYKVSPEPLDRRIKERKSEMGLDTSAVIGGETTINTRDVLDPDLLKLADSFARKQYRIDSITGDSIVIEGDPDLREDTAIQSLELIEKVPAEVSQEGVTSLLKPDKDKEDKVKNSKIPEPFAWLERNMVLVEGGNFTMGCVTARDGECDSEKLPAHPVEVRTFYICRYEVTQALWELVMKDNESYVPNVKCPLCPVDYISWDQVQKFINKLNRKTNRKYRLPTEAEWEFAARGGNLSKGFLYSGSNDPNEVAWYHGNAGQKAHRVGQKKPNELDLYDMSGNIIEWCEDRWHKDYKGAPKNGKAWTRQGFKNYRVIRGGSWLDDPEYLRNVHRDLEVDSLRNNINGFRLAL